MHPDRTEPEDPRAPERVVGLGAPTTVRLRLPRADAPLLRGEIRAQMERHIDEDDGSEQWRAERAAWQDMLRGLDVSEHENVDVLWPSAYAAPVLYGAVVTAQAAVTATPNDPNAAAIRDSARLTLTAFLEIDNGGLDEVNL